MRIYRVALITDRQNFASDVLSSLDGMELAMHVPTAIDTLSDGFPAD
jgi:hypothetical protein